MKGSHIGAKNIRKGGEFFVFHFYYYCKFWPRPLNLLLFSCSDDRSNFYPFETKKLKRSSTMCLKNLTTALTYEESENLESSFFWLNANCFCFKEHECWIFIPQLYSYLYTLLMHAFHFPSSFSFLFRRDFFGVRRRRFRIPESSFDEALPSCRRTDSTKCDVSSIFCRKETERFL